MSSRLVDRVVAWGRGLSITARIALLSTLSALFMLSVALGLLNFVLTHELERGSAQFLVGRVRELEMAVRVHGDDPTRLHDEVEVEAGLYRAAQDLVFYARVLDGDGRVLLETPGMGEVAPQSRFAAADAQPTSWDTPDGRFLMLLSGGARSGGDDGPPRVVQVAHDLTGQRALIRTYRRASLAVLCVAALIAASFGVLVARRGLRPLRQLARAAERIKPGQRNERLDATRWPRELRTPVDAFNGMQARIEHAFERLSQYSADLTHELRTPIQNLIGEAEVALSRERSPEEYREVLESSLEEYQRLSRMIHEMLFLARSENPQMQIARVRLDARCELEAVVDFFHVLAEEHGVSIDCAGQACVDADQLLFRRAVTNLLSNSLRHTPSGGRILVAVEAKDGVGAVVTVSDTGSGIVPEYLPRLCDRLSCADRLARGSQPQGTGLGLAIVKSITELHGGSLEVDSAVGRGTRVSLRFPPARLAG